VLTRVDATVDFAWGASTLITPTAMDYVRCVPVSWRLCVLWLVLFGKISPFAR
jgi:hypothetical protein